VSIGTAAIDQERRASWTARPKARSEQGAAPEGALASKAAGARGIGRFAQRRVR